MSTALIETAVGDLSFNEGLNMLEDGEYSSWVKAIFLGIKNASYLRAIKMSSSFGRYLVDEWLFKSAKVRVKQAEHFNYTKERVDRRLARTPDRPDLWSKILEKSSGPDGLTTDEHHSLGSLFVSLGYLAEWAIEMSSERITDLFSSRW